MNLELIGTIIIGVLGIALICQGHFIVFGRHGYHRYDYTNPEKRDRMRERIAKLLQK